MEIPLSGSISWNVSHKERPNFEKKNYWLAAGREIEPAREAWSDSSNLSDASLDLGFQGSSNMAL